MNINVKSETDTLNLEESLNDSQLEKFYEEKLSFFDDSPSKRKKFNTHRNFQNANAFTAPTVSKCYEHVVTYNDYIKDKQFQINKRNKNIQKLSNLNTNNENEIHFTDINNDIISNLSSHSNTKNKNNNNKDNVKSSVDDCLDNKSNKCISNKLYLINSKSQSSIISENMNSFMSPLFPRDYSNTYKPSYTKYQNNNKSKYSKSLLSKSNTSSKYNNQLKDIFQNHIDKYNEINNNSIINATTVNNNISSISKINANTNNDNNDNNNIYSRGILYKKNTKLKTQKLKEIYDNKIKEECSFTPKINNISKHNNTNESIISNSKEFYKKNLDWVENKNKDISSMAQYNEEQILKECTFFPNSKKKKQIEKEVRGKSKDYIYNKNIDWLQKVKMNIKQNQIEQNNNLQPKSRHKKINQEHLNFLSKPKIICNEEQKSIYTYKRVDNNENKNKNINDLKQMISALKNSVEQNKKIRSTLFDEQ